MPREPISKDDTTLIKDLKLYINEFLLDQAITQLDFTTISTDKIFVEETFDVDVTLINQKKLTFDDIYAIIEKYFGI